MNHIFATAKPDLQRLLDYHFQDDGLLYEAIMAYPYVINGRHISEGNKRLAMIGDFALKVVIMSDCYEKGLLSGPSDNRKKALESTARLEELGRARGLQKHIQAQPHPNGISSYMMATAVKALFGAVFVDCKEDFAVARRVVTAFGALDDEVAASKGA